MITRYKTPTIRRQTRLRLKLRKVSQRLRLSVFRSNKKISAQIIDDTKGATLVSANEKDIKNSAAKDTKLGQAKKIGQALATKATKKKITKVSFDRGKYKFHGRVKALAQGARDKGLIF